MGFNPGSGKLANATDTGIGSHTGLANNQLLTYSSTDALWENVPLTTLAAQPTGGGVETLNALGSKSSGTVNIALGSGNVVSVTVAGNITLTFSGATAGTACSFGLYVTYSGSFSITWPTIKWAGGTPPTQSSTNGQTDIYVFETIDGGTTWFGSQVGANFS